MDQPPAPESVLSHLTPSRRSHDQNPSPPARNGSTGSPGSSDAPLASSPSPVPHVNGNGASPSGEIEANGNGHHIGYTLTGWALVSYGTVQRLGQRRGGESNGVPSGEGHPPADFWIERYRRAAPDDRPAVVSQAAAELQAWKRRPPELNNIKTETLDDLKRRILKDGEGWPAKDVALACRCTPTLVRRLRTEGERNPDDGRPDSSLAHARELHSQGLSLRQIALATGIPKSTLGDALKP